MISLKKYQPEINKVCGRYPVKRLALFGSVLTERFSRDSDIDVLVMFEKKEGLDHFDVYFSLKEELEKVFGRSVDLVVEKKFQNPYFKRSLEKTRKTIYER